MADQTVSTIAATPRPEVTSTFLQIAVLAALASTGMLATNILLPSLPQMAASLNVSTAAVTSAITIFLVVFALGQLVVGPRPPALARPRCYRAQLPAISLVAQRWAARWRLS